MHLFDLLNKGELSRNIEERFVTERHHPELPLTILNYTPKTQYSRKWDDTTRACRGLIYNDETLEVVARPFPKFFNYGEPGAPEPPATSPAIRMVKEDGSLGIVFNYAGGWHVATRGSFVSEQAEWANNWLSKQDTASLNTDKTYQVEIVFPENRIVVDYHGFEGLILLDAIDIESGWSDLDEFSNPAFEHRVDRKMTWFSPDDVDDIPHGKEGFVYLWEDGTRLKLKSPWYVTVHRIVTNLTERSVWEMMVEGRTLDEIKEPIPEEFYEFVEETYKEIVDEVRNTVDDANRQYRAIVDEVGTDATRAEFAAVAVKSPLKKYLFLLHDGRDIDTLALQAAKPSATMAPITTEE